MTPTNHPRRSPCAPLLLLLAVLLCGFPVASAQSLEGSDQAREFQVKALFLYNFANFVEWPPEAFRGAEAPLRMCLFGAVPFGEFLDVVNGVNIRDRTLAVIRTTSSEDIRRGCHILFVGIDRQDRLKEFFADVNHLFVLSVGNTQGFAEQGGVINIFRTRDRQQFEINLNRALENGLFISSDLLSLARIINAD
ncbi:MAG: YfiR family protein [Halomonadaceae bacterium]|nr:MAG: YfiR family protein [Halomonadaceae bacterium]